MEKQSRRGLLKNAAKAAVAVTGGAVMAAAQTKKAAPAAAHGNGKRNALAKPGAPAPNPQTALPFTDVVACNGMLYVAGVGYHEKGTIEQHTNAVLDIIEKNLVTAGSSLAKVVKVNVYLSDIKNFDRMNAVYKTRNWGPIFPARTTVAPAALPGDNAIVEIECIAQA